MKIGIKKSFGTKLFAFTTLLIMLVVGFITIKNSLLLRENLNRQYQSNLIDSTQLVGERILSLLTRWDTRLSYFIQNLLQTKPSFRSDLINAFIDSEDGIVGMTILKVGKNEIQNLATFLKEDDLAFDENSIIKQFESKEVQIRRHPSRPELVMLIRRISIRGESEPIIAVTIFEMKKFSLLAIQDSNTQAYLLDMNFTDLLSGKKYEQIVLQKSFVSKAQKLMKGEVGAGYLGEIKQKDIKYFVAYDHLLGYPLILVIHQNTSAIDQSIVDFFNEMLRWTFLFLLLAVFIAQTITKNLVADLRELSLATQKIGTGRFDTVVKVKSMDEIGQLSASFNLMTRKIVGLLSAEHEKARLDQELSMAQTVQNTFFRESAIKHKNIVLTSFYQPASECGGDWWGHFSLGEKSDLVVIGDATGHGVPAALVTAIAYASTNILADQIKSGAFPNDDPSAILNSLNDLLNRTLQGTLCMSFIALLINSADDTMIFCNGGHPFPIFLPKDPEDSRLGQTKKLLPFRFLLQKKVSTSILGIDSSPIFYNQSFTIKNGDKIIIYTDGLTEAENAEGKQWGIKGLQKLLKIHAPSQSKDLCDAIVGEATQFNAKAKQFDDDVTLVIIEYLKPEVIAA